MKDVKNGIEFFRHKSLRPNSEGNVSFGCLSLKVQQCPYCNYSSKDANRMQLHVMSQHSMQPVIRCPLCQDVLSNKIHLQLHLTHLHSVAPDCVEKLILTVCTDKYCEYNTLEFVVFFTL